MVLKGKPYYMGGIAYHPVTEERCPVNFYGGFVCSRSCDIKASRELENSMPGHTNDPYSRLSSYAQERIDNNWT
jgi:hypothetical protein